MSSFIILAGLCPFMSPADSEKLGGVNNSHFTNSVNVTGQTVPNQYVVTLQNNATDNAIQLLINEVEDNGAQIIGRYDALFKGFSFKTLDNKTTDKIVGFLEENPLVLTINQDREASINPE
jgi:tetrahydromethanopterin S-methyltransferase subunit F